MVADRLFADRLQHLDRAVRRNERERGEPRRARDRQLRVDGGDHPGHRSVRIPAVLPAYRHLHDAGIPGSPVRRHGAHDHGRGHHHDLPAPAGLGHLLGSTGDQYAGRKGRRVGQPRDGVADHRRNRDGLRHSRRSQGLRLGRPDPGQRPDSRRSRDHLVRLPEAWNGDRGGFGDQRGDRRCQHPGPVARRGRDGAVLGSQPAPDEHVPPGHRHGAAVDGVDAGAVDSELLLLGSEPVYHAADPGLGLAGRGAEGNRVRGVHEAADSVPDRRSGNHRLQSVLERYAARSSRRHFRQHGPVPGCQPGDAVRRDCRRAV